VKAFFPESEELFFLLSPQARRHLVFRLRSSRRRWVEGSTSASRPTWRRRARTSRARCLRSSTSLGTSTTTPRTLQASSPGY